MAGNPMDLILSSNAGRPAPGPMVQIPVYVVWVYQRHQRPPGILWLLKQKSRYAVADVGLRAGRGWEAEEEEEEEEEEEDEEEDDDE